jgi:hypothetical protein
MKDIEVALLKSAAKHEGGYVRETIAPFIAEHGEARLRRIMVNLSLNGFLKLDYHKEMNRTFVTLTNEGRRALQ